jgi:hypothetical protein
METTVEQNRIFVSFACSRRTSELSSVKVFAFLFEHKETKVTKVFSFGGTESYFFCYLLFKLKNRYLPSRVRKDAHVTR